MTIIEHKTNLFFVPQPNEYHLVLDDVMPPIALITSAFGLIFDGDRFLMTNLVKRGWDVPGGHIEAGEAPEETVRRELLEETAVIPQSLTLFAHAKITIHADKPDNYKYPHPVSYMVFYVGGVGEIRPFHPTVEAEARQFFPPIQAKQKRWVKHNQALYNSSLDGINNFRWENIT